MAADVPFDRATGELFLRYAGMVARRGYVHNTLGNMAIRVRAAGFAHGVAYTKHAEVSLEEMTLDNIVVTDIPTSRLLVGEAVTSVGHNLNREILRLRPDIGAVIHVHDDHTIALFASGGFARSRSCRSTSRSFWPSRPTIYRRMSTSRPTSAGSARSSPTPIRWCCWATASPRWGAISRRPITG